jgi:hypothetical protein
MVKRYRLFPKDKTQSFIKQLNVAHGYSPSDFRVLLLIRAEDTFGRIDNHSNGFGNLYYQILQSEILRKCKEDEIHRAKPWVTFEEYEIILTFHIILCTSAACL